MEHGGSVMPEGRGCFIRHPAGMPIRCRRQGPGPSATENGSPPRAGIFIESDEWIVPGTLLEVEVPSLWCCWKYRAQVLAAESCYGHCELLLGFLDEREAFHARMVEQLCHIEAYRLEVARSDHRTLDLDQAAREWIAIHADAFPAL